MMVVVAAAARDNALPTFALTGDQTELKAFVFVAFSA
jgi:hypothetical protein